MSRRATRKSAGPDTPEKPAIGTRELEDIYLGEMKYGAGDASPKTRAARQKAEKGRAISPEPTEVDLGHKPYSTPRSPSQQRNRRTSNRITSRALSDVEQEELLEPPSPAASLRTLVLDDDVEVEAEPPADILKTPSFVFEQEPPLGNLSASPSLILQPGGLSGLPETTAHESGSLSVWEKMFFSLCVVPVILAASVQLVTTSTTSYYEFSAISRESAVTLSTVLHLSIDNWLVPFVRVCFEFFKADVVPFAHLLVDAVAWMVEHAMQLLLLAGVLAVLRLLRMHRATVV